MSSSSSHDQQNNPWFGISMVLIGIIAGYVIAVSTTSSGPARTPMPEPPSAPVQQPPEVFPEVTNVVPVDLSKDHIRGNKKAKIALIEYSDLECPYCKVVHSTYKQIVDQYGDDVMWVYRHFPLEFHANAMKESEASECVAELGGDDAFWQFIDLLYERTTSGGTGFPLSELAPLAAEIGVDQGRFQACLDSGKYTALVEEQLATGQASGVQGTPGNILYNIKEKKGIVVSGARPFAQFEAQILKMLQ